MVTGDALNVAFFGTPTFALTTLEAILPSRHRVVLVVTQPDRPRGRGQRVSEGPVAARAKQAGLQLLQPATLGGSDILEAFERARVQVGVVAAYGKLLPPAVFSRPRLGMINVHASLLPRHRGAAPVHRAIIAGDHETGVTIMRVVKALDAGPMLARATRPIRDEETSVDVEADLARMGGPLLVEQLDALAAGRAVETPQDETAATYAPRLTKADGLVDWSREAAHIHNLIRGLHPWPHAYTFLQGGRLILLRSSPLPSSSHALPGVVVSAHADDLVVAAGSGLLRIHELQPEGRRPMRAQEFLAGHRLAPGAALSASP